MEKEKSKSNVKKVLLSFLALTLAFFQVSPAIALMAPQVTAQPILQPVVQPYIQYDLGVAWSDLDPMSGQHAVNFMKYDVETKTKAKYVLANESNSVDQVRMAISQLDNSVDIFYLTDRLITGVIKHIHLPSGDPTRAITRTVTQGMRDFDIDINQQNGEVSVAALDSGAAFVRVYFGIKPRGTTSPNLRWTYARRGGNFSGHVELTQNIQTNNYHITFNPAGLFTPVRSELFEIIINRNRTIISGEQKVNGSVSVQSPGGNLGRRTSQGITVTTFPPKGVWPNLFDGLYISSWVNPNNSAMGWNIPVLVSATGVSADLMLIFPQQNPQIIVVAVVEGTFASSPDQIAMYAGPNINTLGRSSVAASAPGIFYYETDMVDITNPNGATRNSYNYAVGTIRLDTIANASTLTVFVGNPNSWTPHALDLIMNLSSPQRNLEVKWLKP